MKTPAFEGPLTLTSIEFSGLFFCNGGAQSPDFGRGNFRGEFPPSIAFTAFWPSIQVSALGRSSSERIAHKNVLHLGVVTSSLRGKWYSYERRDQQQFNVGQ